MIRRLFTLVPLLHLYVGLRLLRDLPFDAPRRRLLGTAQAFGSACGDKLHSTGASLKKTLLY